MGGKPILQIVVAGGEGGKFRDGLVVERQILVVDGPVADVFIAVGQHGGAPDVAETAERQGRQ